MKNINDITIKDFHDIDLFVYELCAEAQFLNNDFENVLVHADKRTILSIMSRLIYQQMGPYTIIPTDINVPNISEDDEDFLLFLFQDGSLFVRPYNVWDIPDASILYIHEDLPSSVLLDIPNNLTTYIFGLDINGC